MASWTSWIHPGVLKPTASSAVSALFRSLFLRSSVCGQTKGSNDLPSSQNGILKSKLSSCYQLQRKLPYLLSLLGLTRRLRLYFHQWVLKFLIERSRRAFERCPSLAIGGFPVVFRRMLSLSCPRVNLCRKGLDLVFCGCPLGRSYLRPQRSSGAGAVRCPVSSTQNVEIGSLESAGVKPLKSSSGPVSVSSLIEVVSKDLQTLNDNLQSIVGAENPVLISAAEQIFGAGGKRLRPALVFLVSRATAQIAGLTELTTRHRRLAEIIEMIHTASLIHDDVLDDSGMRRGKETIHQLYGTRVAVLAGDFMFAQSSWYLANLENLEVIKLISQVIKDFASGEIKQASSLFDCDVTLEEYLLKSYYKTASLVASSTKAAAIFSGVNSSICEQMYEYGKNLGLSFQVVDDILDFTQSAEQLGKPAASDLANGNLTAPVIFALEKEPKLREIIDSEFTKGGSLNEAIELVHKCGGIERARNLAREKAVLAIQNLQCLPPSEFRSSLEGMVRYNLERID